MNRIHLTQDGNNQQSLVNEVMKLQFPSNAGNFIISFGCYTLSKKNSDQWTYSVKK